jgi:hypothetical protein
MQFILDTNNNSRVISGIFQVIDDDSINLGAERSEQMCHEIVSERTLFGDLAHEHRDRAAHGLIDINDEHLVVIAEKHGAPAACRQDRPHLHLDHRFVHNRTLSAGTRKTSGAERMCRFLSYTTNTTKRFENLIVQACMFNTLIEYAFCGIHSPQHLIK